MPLTSWAQALPVTFALPRPETDQTIVRAAELEEIYVRLEAAERRLQEAEIHRAPAPHASNDYFIDAPADDSSMLAARLKAIEDDLKKQSAAAEKKKAADALKPTQKWTGRIHADYWAFPGTSPGANAYETGDATDSVDDRFLFRRVRLGIQGTIPDNMQYKLEIDINSPNQPQLKDVYIGWVHLPLFQTVLVGNQKRPYGLDYLNSSRYNVFLERPAIVEAFNQDVRRFGIVSYGVSTDKAYNWRFGGYMSQDMQNVGTVFATPDDQDYQAEFAGRLANTIWYDETSGGRGYAHWAIAGTIAGTDGDAGASSTARFQTRPEARTADRWLDTDVILNAETYQLVGLEGVLNAGALQVVGELQQVQMQRDGDSDLTFGGGYVYVSYFLTGEHMPWERTTGQLARVEPFQNFFLVRTCDEEVDGGWGAWQVAVRYSHADFTDDDIAGGVLNSVTCGLNWYWNPYSRMQFNYIYGDIDDHFPIDGQTSAFHHIIGTRFSVDF